MPPHLAPLVERLSALPVENPPLPWKHIQTYAVGGLTDAGYGEDSDLLLVVSGQGRGVFDCITGEKVARDYDDSLSFVNYRKMTAEGIGPLAGQSIRIAGLSGGGLPRGTAGH